MPPLFPSDALSLTNLSEGVKHNERSENGMFTCGYIIHAVRGGERYLMDGVKETDTTKTLLKKYFVICVYFYP